MPLLTLVERHFDLQLPPAKDQLFQTDHCTTPLQYPHRTEVDQPNRVDHEGPPGPQSQQKILSVQVRDDEEPQGSGNPVAQQSTSVDKVRDDEEPQGSGNPEAQQSTTTGKVRDDEEPQGSGNPEAQQSSVDKVRDDEKPQGSGNPVAQQSTITGKVRDDEEPQGSGNPEAQQSSVNKKFDEIADCLYQLTVKKAQFHWNEEHETAFKTLKKIAMSREVLSYPTKTDSFVLDTDASDMAVGAALLQIQDGVERPISFTSKILQPTQRKYCTTRSC